MGLEIRKKSLKVWKFIDTVNVKEFIPSRFSVNTLDNTITVVYKDGANSETYNLSDVELYDVNATNPFPTFVTIDALMLKLEQMNCPCYFIDGDYVFSPTEWISQDVDNSLELGTDGKFFVPQTVGSSLSVSNASTIEFVDTLNFLTQDFNVSQGQSLTQANIKFKDIVISVTNLPTGNDILTTKIYYHEGVFKWWNGSTWLSQASGGSSNVVLSHVNPNIVYHTGTILETQVFQHTFPAGTFNSVDKFKITDFNWKKAPTISGNDFIQLRISTNGIFSTILPRIAQFSITSVPNRTDFYYGKRFYTLRNGFLEGMRDNYVLNADVGQVEWFSYALNPANAFTIHVSVILGNAGNGGNLSALTIEK